MYRISVTLILLTLIAGCDSQEQQNDFVDDAGAPPSGYTSTNALGEIISQDDDDWRVAPIFFGKVRVDPVYPNPSSGEFVTLPISILEFNALQGGLVLRAHDSAGQLRLLDDIDDTGNPGAYIFRFSPVILGRTGLARLFIFDRLGELVSYGDIQIGQVG